VDVETVSEHEGLAVAHIRGDVLTVNGSLNVVLGEQNDDIGLLGDLVSIPDLEPDLLGGSDASLSLLCHKDFHTRIAEVLRLSLALNPVPDHADRAVSQGVERGVLIVVDPGHLALLLSPCRRSLSRA